MNKKQWAKRWIVSAVVVAVCSAILYFGSYAWAMLIIG